MILPNIMSPKCQCAIAAAAPPIWALYSDL